MAHIVFFCPFRLSGAAYGGSVRVLGLADAFAGRGHDVAVSAFVTPAEGWPRRQTRPSGALLRERCDVPGLLAVLGRMRLAPRVLPVALAARANRWRLDEAADVAVYAFPWLWPAPRARAAVEVVDFHNCEADWFAPDLAEVPFASAWRRFVEAAEARAWREAPIAWCASDRDRSRLAERYGARPGPVLLVPSGAVPTSRPSPEQRRASRAALGIAPSALVGLFVGFRMRYNVEGLVALAAAWDRLPAAERPVVLVVGTVAEWLPPLPDNFRVVGHQKDLEPWVAASDVALNPSLGGSGSNTKVSDLLARGLPVVTTPFGLRGFEAYRDSIAVAELEDFPDAMARVRCTEARFPEGLRWEAIARKAEASLGYSASSSPAWTPSPLPEST